MGANTGKLTVFLNANSGQFFSEMQKVQTKLGSIGSGLQKLGGIMAGAFAADKIIQYGKEASEMAGKFEGIKAAFDKLNQPNLLGQMRDAVKGTVNDMELMRNAVKAAEYGIPLEKMGTAMKFAAIQAQKLGDTTENMLDSLIGSVSTQSKMRLDNLGISMVAMNEEMAKGKDFADAAFSLMNEKLGQGAELMDTAATRQAALTSQLENFKMQVGELTNDVVELLLPALTKLAQIDIISIFKPIDSAIQSMVEHQKAFYDESDKLGKEDLYGYFTKQVADLGQQIENANAKIAEFDGKKWYEATSAEAIAVAKLNNSLPDLVHKLEAFKQVVALIDNENKIPAISNKTTALADQTEKAGEKITKTWKDISKEIGESTSKIYDEYLRDLGMQMALYNPGEHLSELRMFGGGHASAGPEINDPSAGIGLPEETIDAITYKLPTLKTELDIVGVAANQMSMALTDSFAVLGESIGNLFTGDAGAGSFFDGLVQIMGGFMKALGGAMIAAGVATIAFKKSLFANPVVAIGAGVALIAAATVATNLLKKGPVPKLANGGLAYGPTMAMVGDNPGARTDPEVIAPLSKLQGMSPKVVVVGKLGISMGELRLAISEANDDYYRNY